MKKNGGDLKVLATNRKAHHDYFILETHEAGMALLGTEVKSAREGNINLKEAFCAAQRGELFLENCHISPYGHGGYQNHEPLRNRKLLLHKREIIKLTAKVAERGLTIVPLRAYVKDGRVKLEIGLAKGKKSWDKREDIKRRETDREIRRRGKD